MKIHADKFAKQYPCFVRKDCEAKNYESKQSNEIVNTYFNLLFSRGLGSNLTV
jgi:hypothetical protein